MRKTQLLVLFLTLGSINAQVLLQIYPDSVSRWSLLDNDEFDGKKVDSRLWKIGFPWSRAILSQKTYVLDNNVKLEGGQMCLVLQRKDTLIKLHPNEIDSNYFRAHRNEFNDNNFLFQFTGSLLWSVKNYKYGYYELKFKGPVGQGIWPAFWLYGGNPNYEIDFFELKGEKSKSLHVDVHCPKGCSDYKSGPLGYKRSWGHWIKTSQNFQESFNILGASWTPEGIRWYLNGEIIAASDHRFDISMSLSIGIGVAMDDGPFKPGPNKATPFPNEFCVDYLRVYSYGRSASSESTPVQNRIEYVGNATFSAIKTTKKPRGTDTGLKPFTVSLLPINEHLIHLRVLGVHDDPIEIYFMDDNGRLISKRRILSNVEESLDLGSAAKAVQVLIKTRRQTIYERLIL